LRFAALLSACPNALLEALGEGDLRTTVDVAAEEVELKNWDGSTLTHSRQRADFEVE
jgi:hypothetical protein